MAGGADRRLLGARQILEVVAAALSLVQESPQLKTLVLECTNLPPYQSAIEMATGLKVLSLRDNPVLDKAANE